MTAREAVSLRVLLVAEQAAGARVLRLLAGSQHQVVAVATTLGAEKAQLPTVAALAKRLELPLLEAGRVRDPAFAEWIRSQRIDLLLNVSSLHVAAAETVAAPKIGSFNLHPGPLPEYAGLNAPSWAIYFGERHHATTLHWMAREVDAGPIAYSSSFPLEDDETGLTLTLKCVERGLPLVAQLLAAAATDPTSIPVLEQGSTGSRFFGAEVPEGGVVRWRRPARELVAFVRACDYLPFESPWGHPRVVLACRGDEWIEVVKASVTGEPSAELAGTVVSASSTGVLVAAADERVLVERVRVAGRHLDPARVLEAGLRLEADPLASSRRA